MRPRIGLTRAEAAPDSYRRALAAAGAEIVEFRCNSAEGGAAGAAPDAAVGDLDGLLLPGGADIAPHLYGESAVHRTVVVTPGRDELELALCAAALSSGLPVLGICRGIQVLNVAAGGTLWQDLPALCPGISTHLEAGRSRDRRRRLHTVKAAAGTLADSLLGSEPLAVNSIHHQAVRDPAPGLRVSAQAPDGVVEAVEAAAGGSFALGVQWHPEEIWREDGRQACLFAALCRAAVERARRR